MKKLFFLLLMVISTTAMAQQFTHSVKAGETLSSIAAQYNVTVDQLRAANPQVSNSFYVGMALNIPGNVAQQPATQTNYDYSTYNYAQNNESSSSRKAKFRPKGYNGFFEVSSGLDLDGGDILLTTVTTIHGFRFNPRIFLGLGVEAQAYNHEDFHYTALPVFLDFRYTMLKSRVTPFLELRSGYEVLEASDYYYGLQLGLDVAITQRFGLYTGLIARSQLGYDCYNCFTHDDLDNMFYLSLNFGLHF